MSGIRFHNHDDGLAEITVLADAAATPIARVARDPGVTLTMGPASAPWFSLAQTPYVPDEGWTLHTAARAAPLSAPAAASGADAASCDAIDWSYLTWAEGSAAEAGVRALAGLPPGRYWLARTSRAFVRPPTVLLGNAIEPRPANAVVLEGCGESTGRVYAAAFGANPAAPPPRACALLGAPIFGYTGMRDSFACLFFEHAPFVAEGREADARESVLIVPASGPLVIDALGPWRDAGESASLLATWEQSGARATAHYLSRSIV